MSREFVIGDIHGAHKALLEVLDKSGFDKSQDTLFCLGDLVDGWPENREVIEELMTIPNLKLVKGNHDWFFLEWIRTGEASENWLTHGGTATLASFQDPPTDDLVDFLKAAQTHIVDKNRLFVHGGVKIDRPLNEQDPNEFLWDRTLYKEAWSRREKGKDSPITEFSEVFIGHTPIHRIGHLSPQKVCEVWMMDTGAGWEGVLSLMDLQTHQIYQSTPVHQLYPDHEGRS